jgi:ribosomal protein L7/L12
MLNNGHDIENVLLFLREKGCTKTESIKAVMDLQGTSLREAKSIIHFSRAWKDTRQKDDDFHKLLDSTSRYMEPKKGE